MCSKDCKEKECETVESLQQKNSMLLYLLERRDDELKQIKEKIVQLSVDVDLLIEIKKDLEQQLKIETSLREGAELAAQRLENEVSALKETLKNNEQNIQHYRGMIRGLQGNFTVINRYNYRLCVKNPGTGEWEYRLIKLPSDFDPFNPSNITPDGIEVFEDFSVEVPTRLGDIIRKEFTRDEIEEYPPYWPATTSTEKDEHIQWQFKREKQ